MRLTIVARPYFSFSPPRDNEKLGLASQTSLDREVTSPRATIKAPSKVNGGNSVIGVIS